MILTARFSVREQLLDGITHVHGQMCKPALLILLSSYPERLVPSCLGNFGVELPCRQKLLGFKPVARGSTPCCIASRAGDALHSSRLRILAAVTVNPIFS